MTAEEPSGPFWQRFGLSEADRLRCLEVVKSRYTAVQELEQQGYCSLTLLVYNLREKDARIVQMRPARHTLDLGIAKAAKETYPALAPFIHDLDLDLPIHAYEMQRICGTPLSRVLSQSQVPDPMSQRKHECLIECFAATIAQGLKPAELKNRTVRADSPMEERSSMLNECTGKVGSSIISRLEKLRNELPTERLRDIASHTLARVKIMDDYPVVLNHGDLIPSNILVDEDTWEITGLVDWAEAENLPFGTCLYSLEHCLGFIGSSQNSSSTNERVLSPQIDGSSFVYYENASQLRGLFWRRLFDHVPYLKIREEEVRTIRDLGVLLWYGFAWDDGAIDRVVNAVDDPVEMACLQAFLDVD